MRCCQSASQRRGTATVKGGSHSAAAAHAPAREPIDENTVALRIFLAIRGVLRARPRRQRRVQAAVEAELAARRGGGAAGDDG